MRFDLTHPGFRTCDQCETWMYDPQTGALKDYPPNSGNPLRRPQGVPTPCQQCPKVRWAKEKTPAEGRKVELSAKNKQTLELYQCIHGARLRPERLDATTVHNLAAIHRLYLEHHER